MSETPKASRGVEYGEGIFPSPANYKDLGERRKLPQRHGDRGGAPAEIELEKSECQKSHLVAHISLNFLQRFYSGCTGV